MSNLVVSVGSCRSGKTTFFKKWMLETGEKPRVVVTTDNIRLALHGKRYNHHSEALVFSIKEIMIKTLLLEQYEVGICGTHTTETSIRRILEIDPNAKFIVFDPPIEVLKQRAIDTNQADLLPVIDRHHKQLKHLLSEGIENVVARLNKDILYRRGLADE